MTPNRAGGRPRSEEHRDAVLKAATELMQEDDLRIASIDRISARSGVSKATILAARCRWKEASKASGRAARTWRTWRTSRLGTSNQGRIRRSETTPDRALKSADQ